MFTRRDVLPRSGSVRRKPAGISLLNVILPQNAARRLPDCLTLIRKTFYVHAPQHGSESARGDAIMHNVGPMFCGAIPITIPNFSRERADFFILGAVDRYLERPDINKGENEFVARHQRGGTKCTKPRDYKFRSLPQRGADSGIPAGELGHGRPVGGEKSSAPGFPAWKFSLTNPFPASSWSFR